MSPRGQYARQPRAEAIVETAPAKAKGTPAPVIGVVLTAKTKGIVDDIRKPFKDFTNGYALLTASRRELAPKFMKAFAAWATETGETFIAFVRMLDPNVPSGRQDYRAHASYQAADYLRRLTTPGAQQGVEVIPVEDRPATPYVALARVWATIVPLLDPEGEIAHRLLEAIAKELNWTEAQVERIESLAESQGPVKLPPSVKKQLKPAAA